MRPGAHTAIHHAAGPVCVNVNNVIRILRERSHAFKMVIVLTALPVHNNFSAVHFLQYVPTAIADRPLDDMDASEYVGKTFSEHAVPSPHNRARHICVPVSGRISPEGGGTRCGRCLPDRAAAISAARGRPEAPPFGSDGVPARRGKRA